MIPLLVLTSLLLVLSGGFKLRAGLRGAVGLHVPSLVEILAGVALVLRATAGGLTAGQGFAAVVGGVALILASSIHLGFGFRRTRRLRELTEGRRLANFVNQGGSDASGSPHG